MAPSDQLLMFLIKHHQPPTREFTAPSSVRPPDDFWDTRGDRFAKALDALETGRMPPSKAEQARPRTGTGTPKTLAERTATMTDAQIERLYQRLSRQRERGRAKAG